jgi:hypothetical protein
MRANWLALAVGAAAAMTVEVAGADVYQCVARDGGIAYRDSPCPPGTARSRNITSSIEGCRGQRCASQRQMRAAFERTLHSEEGAVLAKLDTSRDRQLLRESAAARRADEARWRTSVAAWLAAQPSDGDRVSYVAAWEPAFVADPACRPRCVGARQPDGGLVSIPPVRARTPR